MDKAFDEMLDRIVYAVDAAKTDGHRGRYYFRYRCPFCSEHIILAAADSKVTTPYFKHRRGGDHALCEAYTGKLQHSDFERIQREFLKHREIFYFNADRKVFEFGVKFSEEEIEEYAKAKRDFAIRAANKNILSESITPSTFGPQTRRFFEVTEYAREYEFLAGDSPVKIRAFDKKDGLSFYRETLIKERYKKIVGEVLYLETNYIALSENYDLVFKLKRQPGIRFIGDIFIFRTLKHTFYGLLVEFHKTMPRFNGVLQDYRVDKLENFRMLWPPAHMVVEAYATNGEELYVKSSFPIKEFMNTTSYSYWQLKELPGIYSMKVSREIQIHEQNVDVTIVRKGLEEEEKPSEVEEMTTNRCLVAGDEWPDLGEDVLTLDGYDFYLFDEGCTRLKPGDFVRLSSRAIIIGYENRHPRQVILPKTKAELSGEDLLLDILRYYPKEEPYDFEAPDAWKEKAFIALYLDHCKEKGKINCVVKKYLMEGRL